MRKDHDHAPAVLLVGQSQPIRQLREQFEAMKAAQRLAAVENAREAAEFLMAEGRHKGRDAKNVPSMLVFDGSLPDAHVLLEKIHDAAHLRYLIPIVLVRSEEARITLARAGLFMKAPRRREEFKHLAERIHRLLPE